MTNDAFSHPKYLLRRKVLKLFGGAFHIFDESGGLVLFGELKAFKLREDIRVYPDELKSRELLTIKARQIIDFSSAYDVVDSTSGQKVGGLRRKGLKSILRDEWQLLDAHDQHIGTVLEDGMLAALVRRFATNLIPQGFHAEMGGTRVANFWQRFNPFVFKLEIDFTLDTDGRLDRRLGLAAAILLGAVEGRQH